MKAPSIVNRHTVIADPPLARFLFSDTRMAIVWLALRVYVGYSWLDAGWHKILDTGAKTNYIIDGSGLLAFWQRIAAVPAAPAKPVIIYDWYRGFIQFLIDAHAEAFMGKVVAFGETAVGIGLILGAFVGVGRPPGISDSTGSYFHFSARLGRHRRSRRLPPSARAFHSSHDDSFFIARQEERSNPLLDRVQLTHRPCDERRRRAEERLGGVLRRSRATDDALGRPPSDDVRAQP